MAIGTCYAIGNEITGVVTTGAVTVVQNGSFVRPESGSRCALEVGIGSTTDPPPNSFQFAQNFTATSSFFLLSVLSWNALGGSADLNCVLLSFLDSSGVARLMIRGAGSGAIKISTRNAAGTFVDLATSAAAVMPIGGLSPFPVNVEVVYNSNPSIGFVEVRLADNVVVSYTGANTTDGATQLANVLYANCDSSNGAYWSERWVSSVTLLNATVLTLPPLAPGIVQQWSGVVADINSVTINDVNFISDGTAGDLSGWTVATALPTGAWAIQAFGAETRLSAGNTGPQHADFYLRTGSTDAAFGDSLAPPVGSFANFGGAIWGVSPVTSAAWTIAEFTAGLNFGLKSLS